jgi:hypothetical protein
MSIDFRLFHLQDVVHLLNDDFREKRKDSSIAMLPFLHAVERDRWHHLVTGDESGFFFHTSPHRV